MKEFVDKLKGVSRDVEDLYMMIVDNKASFHRSDRSHVAGKLIALGETLIQIEGIVDQALTIKEPVVAPQETTLELPQEPDSPVIEEAPLEEA